MDGDTGEFESRFVINPISIKTNNISSLSKITLTLDSDIAEKLFDILVCLIFLFCVNPQNSFKYKLLLYYLK